MTVQTIKIVLYRWSTILCVGLVFSQVSAAEMTDPTKPPAAVLSTLPDSVVTPTPVLQLNGVQVNGKDSVAIINHTMVRVGDQIQGYTLRRVSNGQAILAGEDQSVLKLDLGLPEYRHFAPAASRSKPNKHKSRVQRQRPAQMQNKESHS